MKKELEIPDGSLIPYDILIIATGARNIALPVPGADLQGVLSLRTAQDAELLKRKLGPGKHLVTVGGGYIGLEVAASGRALGAEVTLIKREEPLLSRVACGVLGQFFRTYPQRGLRSSTFMATSSKRSRRSTRRPLYDWQTAAVPTYSDRQAKLSDPATSLKEVAV